MDDGLFAEVNGEGATLDIDKAFERLETKEDKTASASQAEKKETDKPSQKGENTSEEKLPFHKHPRWIKNQEELRLARAEAAEAKAKAEALEKSKKETVLPDWWKNTYGDTEESKKQFQAYETGTQAERDRLRQEIKEDLQKESQQEASTKSEADQYVEEQMAEMSEEGLKFERNALLKFMVDFQTEYGPGSLLDSEGNYDFRKALSLMQKMQPEEEAENTNKQLAAQAGRGKASSGSSSKIPVVSTRALRKGGWREAGI